MNRPGENIVVETPKELDTKTLFETAENNTDLMKAIKDVEGNVSDAERELALQVFVKNYLRDSGLQLTGEGFFEAQAFGDGIDYDPGTFLSADKEAVGEWRMEKLMSLGMSQDDIIYALNSEIGALGRVGDSESQGSGFITQAAAADRVTDEVSELQQLEELGEKAVSYFESYLINFEKTFDKIPTDVLNAEFKSGNIESHLQDFGNSKISEIRLGGPQKVTLIDRNSVKDRARDKINKSIKDFVVRFGNESADFSAQESNNPADKIYQPVAPSITRGLDKVPSQGRGNIHSEFGNGPESSDMKANFSVQDSNNPADQNIYNTQNISTELGEVDSIMITESQTGLDPELEAVIRADLSKEAVTKVTMSGITYSLDDKGKIIVVSSKTKSTDIPLPKRKPNRITEAGSGTPILRAGQSIAIQHQWVHDHIDALNIDGFDKNNPTDSDMITILTKFKDATYSDLEDKPQQSAQIIYAFQVVSGNPVVDGVYGNDTKKYIGDLQSTLGVTVTGKPNPATIMAVIKKLES